MERKGDSSEVNIRHSSKARKYNEDRDRTKYQASSSRRRDSRHSRSPDRGHRRRSRSESQERRSSSDRGRHHRRSRSPARKLYDRKSSDDKYEQNSNSNLKREKRSRSTERVERNRERNKIEMRQLMAKNYEEQIEKMKSNSTVGQKTYNAPIDPSKLVEQIERRKLLWSKKDKPAEAAATSSTSVWKQTKFSDDSDGKVTAKFKRLMGMKEEEAQSVQDKADAEQSQTVIRKQEEYFADLEKQYEVARATTHTQRGVGLGFSSRSFTMKPKP